MKRIVLPVLMLVLVLGIVSCQKEEKENPFQTQANEFGVLVEEFGEVTLNKENDLVLLKERYVSLPNEVKALAQEAYETLVLIDNKFLDLLINNYGEVKLESIESINKAFDYYETLLDKTSANSIKLKLDADLVEWNSIISTYVKSFEDKVNLISITTSDKGEKLDQVAVLINDANTLYNELPTAVKKHDSITEVKELFDEKKLKLDQATTLEETTFKNNLNSLLVETLVKGSELDNRIEIFNIVKEEYEILSEINKNNIEVNFETILTTFIKNSSNKEIADFEEQYDNLLDLHLKIENSFNSYEFINEVIVLYDNLSEYSKKDQVIIDLKTAIETIETNIPNLYLNDISSFKEELESKDPTPFGNMLDEYYEMYLEYKDLIDNYDEISVKLPETTNVLVEVSELFITFVQNETEELATYLNEIGEDTEYSDELLLEVTNKFAYFSERLSKLSLTNEDTNTLYKQLKDSYQELLEFVGEIETRYEYSYETVDPSTNTFTGTITVYAKVFGPSGNEITTVNVKINDETMMMVNDEYVYIYEFSKKVELDPNELNSFLIAEDKYYVGEIFKTPFVVTAGAKQTTLEAELKTPLDSINDLTYQNEVFTIHQSMKKTNIIVDIYVEDVVVSFTVSSESFTLFDVKRALVKKGYLDQDFIVDLKLRRTIEHNLFTDSIEIVFEDLLVHPTSADVLRAPSSNQFIYYAGNKAVEANRNGALLDVANPSIDKIVLYIFESNETNPNSENAIAEIEHRWVNGKFVAFVGETEFVYIDIYGHFNLYLEAPTATNMIKLALGSNYNKYQRYYFANQVFVTEDGEFDLEGNISGYGPSYYQEEVYIEPTEQPPTTTLMGYAEGNGNTAMAFDRFETIRINNENIKHVIVRIYTDSNANKESDMIGQFTFFYDTTGKVNANGTIITLAGGVGNFYVFGDTVKTILENALGSNYSRTQQYYFSNQIIISETTEVFERDGEISELHANYWREVN